MGTLTLTGAHTYLGYTRVETGTPLVNGSIGLGQAPDVELFGGTLAVSDASRGESSARLEQHRQPRHGVQNPARHRRLHSRRLRRGDPRSDRRKRTRSARRDAGHSTMSPAPRCRSRSLCQPAGRHGVHDRPAFRGPPHAAIGASPTCPRARSCCCANSASASRIAAAKAMTSSSPRSKVRRRSRSTT